MYYHNTIRRYVIALLDFFNNTEIQYKNSDGDLITKQIPVNFKFREKSEVFNVSEQQAISGNMNILPRAFLTLTSVTRALDRATVKYLKINMIRDGKKESFQYNAVPYDLTFECNFMTRGMSEACQIIEQLGAKFNPNIAIDMYPGDELDEAIRTPIQLTDINAEPEEYEEFSMNLVRVTCSVLLPGFFFQPIQDYAQILHYRINLRTPSRETEILDFDVVDRYIKMPGEKTTVFKTQSQDKDLESRIRIAAQRMERFSESGKQKAKVLYETNAPTVRFSWSAQSHDMKLNSKDIIESAEGNICVLKDGIGNAFTLYCIIYAEDGDNRATCAIQKRWDFTVS